MADLIAYVARFLFVILFAVPIMGGLTLLAAIGEGIAELSKLVFESAQQAADRFKFLFSTTEEYDRVAGHVQELAEARRLLEIGRESLETSHECERVLQNQVRSLQSRLGRLHKATESFLAASESGEPDKVTRQIDHLREVSEAEEKECPF